MTPLIPSYLLYGNSWVGQERAGYFTLLEPRPTEGSLAGLVLGHLRYCTGGVFCLQVQCERECMSQLIDLTLQRKEEQLQDPSCTVSRWPELIMTHTFSKAQTLLLTTAPIPKQTEIHTHAACVFLNVSMRRLRVRLYVCERACPGQVLLMHGWPRQLCAP